MRPPRPAIALAAWLAIVVGTVAAVSAASGSGGQEPGSSGTITATLDGTSLDPAEINRHHCHDASFPLVECFELEADRDADLGDRLAVVDPAPPVTRPAPAGPCSGCPYVTLYWDINWAGSSLSLAYAQSNLGVFGWNDATSSYLARNCGEPRLYLHADFGGTSIQTAACAGLNFTGTLSSWNDQASSVVNLN